MVLSYLHTFVMLDFFYLLTYIHKSIALHRVIVWHVIVNVFAAEIPRKGLLKNIVDEKKNAWNCKRKKSKLSMKYIWETFFP